MDLFVPCGIRCSLDDPQTDVSIISTFNSQSFIKAEVAVRLSGAKEETQAGVQEEGVGWGE